jgi:hypothetical protein
VDLCYMELTQRAGCGNLVYLSIRWLGTLTVTQSSFMKGRENVNTAPIFDEILHGHIHVLI